MDKLQDVIAEMRDWANGEGCFNDDPDGEPLPCVYYSQQAFLKLCDRLEAATALQAAPEGGDALAAAQENGAIGYIHCGQFGRYIEFFDGKDMKDFAEQFLFTTTPRHPADERAVYDSMVERAADAYEAAAVSEGFSRVEGSERVTHLRFIRAAIDAALQAGTP